jgi:uncharacterized protein (TIGR00299 family) protein
MKVAYLDCISGASGNMLMGAFLDAGAPLASVQAAIDALGLGDAAALQVEKRASGEIQATHVAVEVVRPQSWQRVSEIDQLIARAPLQEGVRERSRLAFRLLAQAEASAHGVALDEVRLHEAGAVDAVVDVVGTFAAAEALGVEAFYASALPLCHNGTVASEHGELPLPAPATVRILEMAGAPTYDKEGRVELVTPTGAAIIGACAVFSEPAMTSERQGYGAGTADLAWANVLRVVIGDVAQEEPLHAATSVATAAPAARSTSSGLREEEVVVLETNIDDMPANLLADIPRALLVAGALEAFITPVVMKKGRPANLLTVVCDPSLSDALAYKLVRETSTLGVRIRQERRLVAERRVETMSSSLGEVNVKLKVLEGRVVDARPEHDDVARLAEVAGIPITEAHRRLSDEARRRFVTEQ